MMKRVSWMDQSLERSAKLSLDVLERAKRRGVNWPAEFATQPIRQQDCLFFRGEDHELRSEDAEDERARLDEAFSTMVKFMASTTEQCERYYNYKPTSNCSRNEVNHVCRYHNRNEVDRLLKSRGALKQETFASFQVSPPIGMENLKDVHIGVFPGTYSISAHSQGLEHKTQLVNITPGQSVDVRFTL